jgi:membrane protein HdeD
MQQEPYQVRPDSSHSAEAELTSTCPSPSDLALANVPSGQVISASGFGWEKERHCEPQRTSSRLGAGGASSGTHHPDFISLHQQLDGYYRKVFSGVWQPYAVNGAFSILAGSVSLIVPIFWASSVPAYAGSILMVRGVLTLASVLKAPFPKAFRISLLSSFLYLLTGICLLLNLFNEPRSLIWLFSVYFVLTGAATILFAMSYRRRFSGQWEWLVVSGVLSLDLALITLSRLPEPFIWTLTIFLGLDFIAHGSALVAVAFASNAGADRRADA